MAGHAGLFGTAEDVARFVRMLLRGGELDGARLFRPETVAQMLRPVPLPDGVTGGTRCLLLDVSSQPFSSCRGSRFRADRSAGHTGFTGTMLWLDDVDDAFVVLLTNAAHPRGPDREALGRLRQCVATVAAEALLGHDPAVGTDAFP
jgi:CubicO group peptidase (beta-lactamase class C family)